DSRVFAQTLRGLKLDELALDALTHCLFFGRFRLRLKVTQQRSIRRDVCPIIPAMHLPQTFFLLPSHRPLVERGTPILAPKSAFEPLRHRLRQLAGQSRTVG